MKEKTGVNKMIDDVILANDNKIVFFVLDGLGDISEPCFFSHQNLLRPPVNPTSKVWPRSTRSLAVSYRSIQA
jgi:hypothetical protein